MSDQPESPVTPGHPDYRRYLSDKLLLRWSTPEDRAGCAMVSSMAFISVPEGAVEVDKFVRKPERMAMSEFYLGDPWVKNSLRLFTVTHTLVRSSWAVCVSLSGPLAFPPKNPASEDSPYVSKVRQEASEAREPVVALIHYKVMKWAFERATCEVDALESWLVACRTDFRETVGAGNIMKGLHFLNICFTVNLIGTSSTLRNGSRQGSNAWGSFLSSCWITRLL